jgi:hypothetical protein
MRRAAFACLLAALLLAGCDKRTLEWSYSPAGPEAVRTARTVALVQEYGWSRGARSQHGELVGLLADELMARGYRVVVLHEPLPPPGPAASGPAGSPSSQPAFQPPYRLIAVPDTAARYAAAKEAQADLLLELHTRSHDVVHGTAFSGPFVHTRFYVTVTTTYQQATLRVSNPRDQSLLAMITVRYEDSCDEAATVAADLCMGLDFVRKDVAARQVTLKGSPGNVKIIRPQTQPAGATEKGARE